MAPIILMLEDESARLARMRRVLDAQLPGYELHVWRDAHLLIREIAPKLTNAAIICLDHDLYTDDPGAPDPGDGLDVANHLATLSPCCPVLIHSSNTPRAIAMQEELKHAGWKAQRVAPIGDDWIESDWIERVRVLIKA